MRTKAILFTDVDDIAFAQTTVPEPESGEVLIESHFTAISPGTELRCLAGKQPDAHEWPFVPGYALAGTVVDAGQNATSAVGTAVVCSGTERADCNLQWGGHIGHAVCDEAKLFAVPQGVDLLEAALAPLAAIAYHGVRVAMPALHESVVVVGLGPIGQLSLRLFSLLGLWAVGCDRLPERVAFAHRAGLEAIQVGDDLATAVNGVLPAGADIVVDATGVPAVLPEALKIAKDLSWDDEPTHGSRVIIQGSYPESITIPYQAAFRKELTVLIPRNYQAQDLRAILDLLGREKLALRDLASIVAAPEDAQLVYGRLQRRDADLMTAAFHWQTSLKK